MSTNDESTTQLAIAMTVGAFALVFLLLGLALAIYPSWSAIGAWARVSDAPGWVQAFGSIGAILAAVGVAAWQAYSTQRIFAGQRQDAKDRDERLFRQRKQMVLTASGYVRYVAQQQIKRLEKHKKDEDLLVIQNNLNHLRGYCERLPIWSMENSTLAGRWGGILEAVVSAESTLVYESKELDSALKGVVTLCHRLHNDFYSARDAIFTQVEDLGID